MTEVPSDPHGVVVANLFDAIARYRRDHPGVIRRYGGGSEFRFWLPRMASGRNPDLGVVLHGAPKDGRGRQFAALAAEVVSTSSMKRDYETKREEFHAYGLLEYWIVDPLQRQVTVLTRHGDTWNELVVRGDELIVSMVLPGFATTVDELWVDVEDEAADDEAADPGRTARESELQTRIGGRHTSCAVTAGRYAAYAYFVESTVMVDREVSSGLFVPASTLHYANAAYASGGFVFGASSSRFIGAGKKSSHVIRYVSSSGAGT